MLNEPTFGGFLAFVSAKPHNERYNYLDNEECAFGQYLYSLGYRGYMVDGWGYKLSENGARIRFNYDFADALVVASGSFSALRDELRSLQDRCNVWINMTPEEVERIERENA